MALDHQSPFAPVRSHVTPRSLPAPVPVSASHPCAPLDWGWQGLVAYGTCSGAVVVVDPSNEQLVQTLVDQHRAPVSCVAWQHSQFDCEPPRCATLASADVEGVICVWDVRAGELIARFQCTSDNSAGAVTRISWMFNTENAAHLLLSMSRPDVLTMWHTVTAATLWTLSLGVAPCPPLDFALDPFNCSRTAVLVGDNVLLLLDDVTPHRRPSNNFSRLTVSRDSARVASTAAASTATNAAATDGWSTRGRLRRVLQVVTGDIASSSADTVSEDSGVRYASTRAATLSGTSSSSQHDDHQNSRRIQFVSGCRDRLLLLSGYGRQQQLLLLDLQLMTTSTSAGGSCSCLVAACPTARSAVLWCCSEAGVVSVRAVLNRIGNSRCAPLQSLLLSDSPRLGHHQLRAVAASVDPVSESRCVVLLSDGRLVVWRLVLSHCDRSRADSGCCFGPLNLAAAGYFSDSTSRLVVTSVLSCGVAVSGGSHAQIVRVCPPMTSVLGLDQTEVDQVWLVAGTTSGHLLVVSITHARVERELSVHSCAVRGVEWTSNHTVLSFARPRVSTVSSADVARLHNELAHTCLVTGTSRQLRADRAATDRRPMTGVRVSRQQQYAIVVFASGQPLEIWSLRSLSLLRVMPEQFPAVTALDWAPAHSSVRSRRDGSGGEMAASTSLPERRDTAAAALVGATGDGGLSKEHFVFTTASGHVCHFSVEGRLVKDGSRIQLPTSLSEVTVLTRRNNTLALADRDGRLCVWDLASLRSRLLGTPSAVGRGVVRRLCFGPGRVGSGSAGGASAGGMLLLSLTSSVGGDVCVDIWRVGSSDSRVASLRCPQDCSVRVRDADWAGEECVVLLMDDGAVRVCDLSLRSCISCVDRYRFLVPLKVPSMLLTSNAGDSTDCSFERVRRRLLCADRHTAGQSASGNKDGAEDGAGTVDAFVAGVPASLRVWLSDASTVDYDAALAVALLLGDEAAVCLWRLVAQYCAENNDDSQLRRYAGLDLDVLCPPRLYRRLQRLRVDAAVQLRGGNDDVSDDVIRQLIYLGDRQRAAQLLVSRAADSSQHANDCLRACLLATDATAIDAGILRVAATSLVSSGVVAVGVELLCAGGAALDACRYLETAARHDQALHVARCVLPDDQQTPLLVRHAERLAAAGRRREAMLFLVAAARWQQLCEMTPAVDWLLTRTMQRHSKISACEAASDS